jgi:hypothetical protein
VGCLQVIGCEIPRQWFWNRARGDYSRAGCQC